MSKDELGSMSVVLHRERSFHNIDIRTLKSVLQKYARRGMFSRQGVWCLIELDLFSSLEVNPQLSSDSQLTAKQIRLNSVRIRSNMVNRLIAMMSEDVGPCNSDLPVRMHKFYLQWLADRRETSSRETLLRMYHALANEKIQRIRLLSDLRTVYYLPEYLTAKKDLHRQLLEKYQMKDVLSIIYGEKKKGDIYASLIEHLEKKSELAFAYLSVLFQRTDQSWINQQLWPYLLRTSPFPESTRALAFFYKTLKHKEHYLYLYHALAFVIHEDTIRKIDTPSAPMADTDVDQLYRDHCKAENKIELDSFVFDLHTGARTSRSDFALQGAQVTNECQELFIDKYRQMYCEFKIIIDEDEEQQHQRKRKKSNGNPLQKKMKVTSEQSVDEEIIRLGYQLDLQPVSFVDQELARLAHGQRRTGARKKAVFVSHDYVYKGPYHLDDPGDRKRFFYNLHFTRALLALEEHLNIPDHLRSIVDWHSIIKIDELDEYYLKQKSFGKLSELEEDEELVTTKVETNVKVLRRGSHVYRLIEVEQEPEKFPGEEKQIYRACLQHFYLRYLLNIGDSGTWNILLRRDGIEGICGIDFEEIRSTKAKNTNDPLTLIMSKVSKRQREIYQPYIDDILIFRDRLDPSTSLATALSRSFHIDIKDMNERIERYLKCLLKK